MCYGGGGPHLFSQITGEPLEAEKGFSTCYFMLEMNVLDNEAILCTHFFAFCCQEESTATEMDRAGTGNSETRSVAR